MSDLCIKCEGPVGGRRHAISCDSSSVGSIDCVTQVIYIIIIIIIIEPRHDKS